MRGQVCDQKSLAIAIMIVVLDGFAPSKIQDDATRIMQFQGCSDQGPLNGGVSNGVVSRSGLVLPFLSFWDFPGDFPDLSGTLRGFSRLVLFLFLGLLSAPTRNSPERVRDTIWTIPGKSGKHPGLETPRFSFSQSESSF